MNKPPVSRPFVPGVLGRRRFIKAGANRPVAIDLHAHWVPPPYAKAMADLGRPVGNPYPLELDLPHAGGAFPYAAGRLEHFRDHMGGNQPKVQHPFKTYVRRFHYDYLTYHPERFRFLLNLVGSDRIVVGTDSFKARDIEYPSAVVEQFKLPAVDRDRILKGNAIRLFRLEAPARRA